MNDNLIPALIVAFCVYLLSCFAYATYADVECVNKGYDASTSSMVFTYACKNWYWSKKP